MVTMHYWGITTMKENELKIILEKIIAKSKYAASKYAEEQELLAALFIAKQIDDFDPSLHSSVPIQTPLIEAFKDQNFSKAYELIEDEKAEMGPLERAALEIALDSQEARLAKLSPKDVNPNANAHELHRMKEYGLVLGINAVGVDGTHSQFAHIGPTYKLMTDAVKAYSDKDPSSSSFKSIKEAFEFSHDAAKFSYSTPTNPNVGKALSERIQEGKITTIPISCRGHVMGLSIVPDQPPGSKGGYMVFTNRGEGSEPKNHGTQIYRIDDLSKINPEFINNMINGHSAGTPYDEIMHQVNDVAGNQPPVHSIKQKSQKNDNCTVANTRANIHGIMLCQKAIEENKPVQALSVSDHNTVKSDYKQFTEHMHEEKIDTLASALRNNPNDRDLRILAEEYIEQHPNSKNRHKQTLQTALNSSAAQQASPSRVFIPAHERVHAVAQEVGSKQSLSSTDSEKKKKSKKH